MEGVEQWLDVTDNFDAPVVVHCIDGAMQSGLFVACSVVKEIYEVILVRENLYIVLKLHAVNSECYFCSK